MPVEDRTIRTSRILPFSPMAIYRVFESPAYLARWWGPEGFTNTFEIFEFKVGGKWKFTMHGPDGKDYPNESEFSQLEPGKRVVIAHQCLPYLTLTIGLTPVDDGTLLSWEQVFANVETARAVESVVGNANEQNLDRMTQVLMSANFA